MRPWLDREHAGDHLAPLPVTRGVRHVRPSAGWRALLVLQLLLCIGVGLVSIVLIDDPEPSGYYDGDGDDVAGAPRTRVATLGDVAVEPGPTLVPIPAQGPAPPSWIPSAPPRRSPPAPSRSPPS